jgi:hypothetical protein
MNIETTRLLGHVGVSQDGRLDGFQIHEIDLPVS